MNKIKLSVLIVILSLVVGVGFTFADALFTPDLNFTNATTVSIGGHNYVITAGSVATSSLTVTATNITVTASNPGTFTFQSPDGFSLANNGSISQACSGATNSVTMTAGVGPVIITPNPAATVCPVTATSSGNGGTGLTGGSGTTTSPPATTPSPTIMVTPVTPSTTTISGCNNGSIGFSTVSGQPCAGNLNIETTVIPGCNGTLGFSTVTGQSCVNNFTTTTTPPVTLGSTPENTTPTSYNFGTVTLKNGSTGNAVEELQEFLNRFLNLGLVVDGRLGPKTIAVIKKWQKAHGLVADGLIGAKTKALMNKIAATQ